MSEDQYSRRAVEVRRRQSQAAGILSQQFSSTSPTCNSVQRPNDSQFSSTSPTTHKTTRQITSLQPPQLLHNSNDSDNFQLGGPCFIQPGAWGGAMAKPTSSSDPNITIRPGLHVVRFSGWGLGQTPVWPTHAARVWVWEGGSRCGFHSELWDSASENETHGYSG